MTEPEKHKKPLWTETEDGPYISMRAVAWIISALTVGGGGVGVYRTFEAPSEKMIQAESFLAAKAHDTNLDSHEIPGTGKGVTQVVMEQQKTFDRIEARVDATDDKVAGVKLILVEFVASSAVKDAVEKNPKLSQSTRDRVRDTVKENLQAERPRQANAGIESLVE